MRPNPELALALLRVTTGLLFAWEGAQAIFLTGLNAETAQFTRLGVPLPLLTAPLCATLNLVAGTLLSLGLAPRLQATVLTVLGAALLAFQVQQGGLTSPLLETVAPLLVGGLAVAVGGGGQPSLDHLGRLGARPLAARPAPARPTPRRTR